MNKDLLNKKEVRIALWVATIVAVGAFLYLTAPRTSDTQKPVANTNNANAPVVNENVPPATNNPVNANINLPKPAAKKAPVAKPVGFVEKKTPHFVSATIANNQVLTQVPSFLKLTFDAPLVKSEQTVLTVKKDDITSATINTASIDSKTLVVSLNTQVTDGNYYVYYVACFNDTGCKDGRFGYKVNLP